MGVRAGGDSARLARLSPEALQRATFAAVEALVAELASKGRPLGPGRLALGRPHVVALNGVARHPGPSYALAADRYGRPEPDPGVPALESTLEGRSPCPFRRVELDPLDDDGSMN